MMEQLRALLAHFGPPADPNASHFAWVPTDLWEKIKAGTASSDDPLAQSITKAEQSVTKGDMTGVQLQAGDLFKLHELVPPAEPPAEAPVDPDKLV